jgi:thioesterase domain-containing protein/NRPS condensation-like uncharacterized protein
MEITVDKLVFSEESGPSMPVTENEVFAMPATPSQMRFWLLHRMRPDNHALNMPIALSCRGNFDFEVAAATLAELVRRHESLRTTFEVVDGNLSQIIHPSFEIPIRIDEVKSLSSDKRQSLIDAIIREEARVQMDLEQGPLIFARVIRVTANEHILLITIHHSVCDGWSNGVLLRDFSEIYDSLTSHSPARLPELTIQFGDYAVWLDQWRKGEDREKSLNFWRENLGRDFVPLQIPRDFNGENIEQKGEIETLLLASETAQKAKEFCATRGVTVYMLLFAVYAIVLHRLTGQEDFLIGTPCANRRQETENLIGPFSNPQVIRVRINKDDVLDSVLKQVQEWTTGAMAHQALPFEDLNEDEFFVNRSSQMSLQVYFIYQKAFMQTQRTASLEIVPLRSVSPGTMFDLMLSIVERSEGLRLQLEYNPGYFLASTIHSILHLYVQILEAMLSSSGRKLGSLPVLDRADQREAGLKQPLKQSMNQLARAIVMQSERFVAPHDALEMQIAGIWETAMGLKNVSIRDSFFDLGGRSLAAMRIVSRINKTYSLDFGLATLFTGNTVERMAELVRKRLSAFGSSSIVPMQPHGSAEPLFIIHGAGGNIIRFYQLAMLLGTDHPVYGIQAQSLLVGQPALLRIEDQAAFYLTEIRERQPKGPYYFLGYSFGGTVALEIAHQLEALGDKVELLAMLDSRQTDCVVDTRRKNSIVARLDRRIMRFLGNFVSLSLGEKITYLWGKLVTRTLRRSYAMASAMGLRSVPPFMKSTDDISWVAAMNYKTKPWSGTITLFRTAIQPDPYLPQDLGWSTFAKGGIEVHELPGDHDLIFQKMNIPVLATKLRDCLNRCDNEKSRSEGIYADESAAVAK